MKARLLLVLGIFLVLMAGCAKKAEEVVEKKPTVQKVEKAEKKEDLVPKVAFFTGTVKVEDKTAKSEMPVRLGMKLKANHLVKTEMESRVEIQMGASENMVVVSENSVMAVSMVLKQDTQETKVKMSFGKIFVDVKKLTEKREEFVVETPTAVAAIRGTGFEVEVEKESGATDVSVVEGEVELKDNEDKGSVKVAPAQKARVERGRKPSKPRRMKDSEVNGVKKWVGKKAMRRVFKRMKPGTRKMLGVTGADLVEKGIGNAVGGKGLSQVKKLSGQGLKKGITKKAATVKDQKINQLNKKAQKKTEAVKKDLQKSVDKKAVQPVKKVQRGAAKKVDGASKRARRGVKDSGAKKKADDAKKKVKDKLKLR